MCLRFARCRDHRNRGFDGTAISDGRPGDALASGDIIASFPESGKILKCVLTCVRTIFERTTAIIDEKNFPCGL